MTPNEFNEWDDIFRLKRELEISSDKLNLVIEIIRRHGCSSPKDCGLHFLAEKLGIEL